jgi:hypothetical protein
VAGGWNGNAVDQSTVFPAILSIDFCTTCVRNSSCEKASFAMNRAPRYIIPNLLGYAHGVRVIWIAPKRSTAGGSLNYYTLLPSAVGMGSNQWHLVGANKYREGLTAKR